jgi:hypothetical protein
MPALLFAYQAEACDEHPGPPQSRNQIPRIGTLSVQRVRTAGTMRSPTASEAGQRPSDMVAILFL